MYSELRATWQAQGFYRILNRMLFLAGNSDQRWRVFARFFALPQPLIERFFAGRKEDSPPPETPPAP